MTETVGFLSSSKEPRLVAGSSYSVSLSTAEEPYVSYQLCDGRRNCNQQRSDCHPGNHISLLITVPMPQPASVPVLAKKLPGSSQAPRPRVASLLRRNSLEAAVLVWHIFYYIINKRSPHQRRAVGFLSSSKSTRLVAGSSYSVYSLTAEEPYALAAVLRRHTFVLEYILNI